MRRLTEGKPVRLILAFAVPMLVGNLLEMLYNMVDSLVVSRVLGVNALAVVGATSSISYLIVGFAIGLAAGLSIVTVQRFGAGDMAGVRKSFGASLVLCLGLAMLFTALGLVCVRPLLRLLGTPPEILEQSLSYIRVIILGIAASVLSVMLGNTLRAVGNSRAPLRFLAVACVLHVALCILFVGGLGFGVAWAAWATILSQLCSAALCFWFICLRVGLTMATYTPQNYGAGKPPRIRQGVVGIAKAMLVFVAVMGAVDFILGRQLAGLFAPGNEAVIGMIYTGLRVDAIGFPVLTVLFLSRNVLQGLGRSTVPMVASLVELCMRGAAALLLSGWLGYLGVCLANPLAWAGAGLLLAVAMVRTLRRLPAAEGPP